MKTFYAELHLKAVIDQFDGHQYVWVDMKLDISKMGEFNIVQCPKMMLRVTDDTIILKDALYVPIFKLGDNIPTPELKHGVIMIQTNTD